VADLAGVAVPPREHVAIDGDAGTDTGGDGEIHHVVGVALGMEPLADDARDGVVVEMDLVGV